MNTVCVYKHVYTLYKYMLSITQYIMSIIVISELLDFTFVYTALKIEFLGNIILIY